MRVAEQGLRAVAKEQRLKLPKDRSHSLTTFSEEEANRVVTRVCDFMKTVSPRTDETGKRIRWI
jgi:hypothetical protein